MDNDDLIQSIRVLAKQIRAMKKQAKKLGIFVEDRDLLSCPRCGLEEDVTFDGLLVVYKASNPDVDTGLRFTEVDVKIGRFRCPDCGLEFVPTISEE